jgi:hypothetical protein
MTIQFIIIIFALFAVIRAGAKLKQKSINTREFFIWLFFWILVIIGVLLPKNLDKIAQKVGVERGADLAIYISIVIIFYLLFKIFVAIEKTEKEITQIVRHIALNNKQNSNEKNGRSDDKL